MRSTATPPAPKPPVRSAVSPEAFSTGPTIQPGLSKKALSVPEPLVRTFARRVQQEGALDLTQGDYKNADFEPHPEVVREAQRLTRNSVHSYGPAAGRLDVRSEIAEFFNRDGRVDYPSTDVRFEPDEVIFTPGTRSGLAMALEVLGEEGTGVVILRPSWEYDWFVERAGKQIVELDTVAPEFTPDPAELRRIVSRGGISSVILNNPHNPTGRVFPRALMEEIVRVCVEHRVYVLYDSVYQRLDYVDAFVNPTFAHPEWRDWVVTLSGLSKMDMFGASTGARACWMVLSDRIRSGGIRARDIIANLSAWLVATPSTLAQDWALAALGSPMARLRRPSPYMRERRDFMARSADALASLGVERTDFGGTFYAPLSFPGLLGEPFTRVRGGVAERATVQSAVDAFELLLSGGIGGIPFTAFAGSHPERYGLWQRLSYGSKDVRELAVFMDRLRAVLTKRGQIGSSAPASIALENPLDAVWRSECTETGYPALDALSPKAFEEARFRFLSRERDPERLSGPAHLRVTGTKHPDATAPRAALLARALSGAGTGPERADAALLHLEWNPLVEARDEFYESIADLSGACNETLIDFEGRQVSPEWLSLTEKVVLALLREGVVPGEDRHLLVRVPNPWLEPDEEKLIKLLASLARTNLLFLLAAEKIGWKAEQNAVYEISVPQINARSDIGALLKIGLLYRQALSDLLGDSEERSDRFLKARIPEKRRAEFLERAARVRLVPLVENVSALACLPELLVEYYGALARNARHPDLPSLDTLSTRWNEPSAVIRVFVAMSDTAEHSGKIAADAGSTMGLSSRVEAERLLASRAAREGSTPPRVSFLVGAGRAAFRGGLDPAHPGVIAQLARADGVTLQGIRADSPESAEAVSRSFRAIVSTGKGIPPPPGPADREALWELLVAGVRAHTETLLRIAPVLSPFGGIVPQTRVRIRPTGSANYGRSIPDYPEEWRAGRDLPDERRLRDEWPEGVVLPRAITFNLACATLGLPPVLTDLAALDRRAAVLFERHVPGYREILASELPSLVSEAVTLLFGRRFTEKLTQRCQRASAALWIDARPNAELTAPTCLFAMQYLRYLAEDSDSWDESKDHESRPTREEELIRDTGTGSFDALAAEKPGDRWTVLQKFVEAEEAPRLLLARELTIEEKREFVDLRIESWLRTLPEPLSRGLRSRWSELRTLPKAELTLRAIEQMVELEKLRGSMGA